MLSLSCVGCVNPRTPLLTVVFGSDYHGSSVPASLPRGDYRLEVDCTGAARIAFRLRSGAKIVHSGNLACAADATYDFRLEELVQWDVSLEIEIAGGSGKAELYRK